jgi:hypothetical protein
LLSWFGALEFLRQISAYRLLIEYVLIAFRSVVPFMLVSVIVLVGFTFAYLFKYENFADPFENLPSAFANDWQL